MAQRLQGSPGSFDKCRISEATWAAQRPSHELHLVRFDVQHTAQQVHKSRSSGAYSLIYFSRG